MEKLVFFVMVGDGVKFFDDVHLINVYVITLSGNRVLVTSHATDFLPRTFVVNIPPEVNGTIKCQDEKDDKTLFHFDVQLCDVTGIKGVIMGLNNLVEMKKSIYARLFPITLKQKYNSSFLILPVFLFRHEQNNV